MAKRRLIQFIERDQLRQHLVVRRRNACLLVSRTPAHTAIANARMPGKRIPNIPVTECPNLFSGTVRKVCNRLKRAMRDNTSSPLC
ncbi:hypothetical protein GCM10011410_14350 [Hoyosella rhizosphaerae]|uniref:Uncharacterized protein n=1 Tax=Hoyosella rhizosphaerae TaxID=1755582 RepID=A0A916XD69_9ACTN|nr:hypothetical protein GCM10011410_14350 [Hoyosella rhizosphaerae]